MLSTVATLAAEAEHHIELPMSHWGFGGVALALFALGLAALFSFRNTVEKVAAGDHAQGGHGADDSGTGDSAHH